MIKSRILFLCNANSARSLMGEALLRHLAGDRYNTFSAGVEPDAPNHAALDTLAHIGINTSGLASEPLEAYADQHFDAVIILCEKAQQRCREWQGQTEELLFWDILDPRLNDSDNAYCQALQEIRTRLQLWPDIKARDDIIR
jgi:protein-tyrosine-phosphatase